MSLESFAENLIEDIETIFDGIKKEGIQVITDANLVVNALIAAESSSTGQTIISILETVLPATAPEINAISLALPVIAKDLNLVDAELSKPDSEIWDDAVAELKTMTGNAKAGTANTIAAWIATIIGDARNIELSIQQCLSFQQAAHASLVIG